jgi:ATP-dependent exoDNAse (exonuclease V) alpha subunit
MSILQEAMRFDNATPEVKAAIQDMKVGRYADAIDRLSRSEVKQEDLATTVAARYLANIQQLQSRGIDQPRVGIVAVTNADRKEINAAIHGLLMETDTISRVSFEKKHLDDPKLTPAEQASVGMLQAAKVDRLIFRQNYREIRVKRDEVVKVVRFDVDDNRIIAENSQGKQITINPMKQERFTAAREEHRTFSAGSQIEARAILKFEDKMSAKITNGARGVIEHIHDKGATVKWHDRVTSQLTNEHLRFVDHAYARTSFKEQGATTHREIIAMSLTGAKVFNRESAYVAASRAKDNTEIVTSDAKTMLKNAGKDASKSTALEGPELRDILSARRAQRPEQTQERQVVQQQRRGRSLSF